MQQPARPAPPAWSRPSTGSAADPWRELEDAVDRLARLALHAHSLAERNAGLPTPLDRGDPARAERLRRLRAGADLGARALQAAVRIDLPEPAPRPLRSAPAPRSSPS